jgi:hypothetical protein
MTKVGKSSGEATFAGTRANGRDAPKAVIRATAIDWSVLPKPGSKSSIYVSGFETKQRMPALRYARVKARLNYALSENIFVGLPSMLN